MIEIIVDQSTEKLQQDNMASWNRDQFDECKVGFTLCEMRGVWEETDSDCQGEG